MAHGFGIIGSGMISRFHARAIADVPDATLVGCVSRRAESAERFAAEHGCKAYGSLEEMLADDAISVVMITTPSGNHMEPAVAAARAGKHVLVEKPLEVTLKRCDRMITSASSTACNWPRSFSRGFTTRAGSSSGRSTRAGSAD